MKKVNRTLLRNSIGRADSVVLPFQVIFLSMAGYMRFLLVLNERIFLPSDLLFPDCFEGITSFNTLAMHKVDLSPNSLLLGWKSIRKDSVCSYNAKQPKSCRGKAVCALELGSNEQIV